MTSSLIRINEATKAELKRLKGIGPKRAAYIHTFRQEVGPISNIFDLATAANINIRTANHISDQIDWYSEKRINQISFWPLITTSIASLWLLGFAYGQLLSIPKDLAELCFNTGIGLILSGALLAAADIALT
ncbi:MAG: helix-hairpin-helix domain-containing protein, partial [Pseudomonadota bacterium]|nr:helix-hairpin-helix domain-containing protein [Pseudomonadota bacterium]